VIDDGVQIRLESSNLLRVWQLSTQLIQEARRVAEIAPRCNRLLTTPQSPIRGDDGRHTRNYACRILSAQRNRARRGAQCVHRVQPRVRAVP
jgi:hypothetical protein